MWPSEYVVLHHQKGSPHYGHSKVIETYIAEKPKTSIDFPKFECQSLVPALSTVTYQRNRALLNNWVTSLIPIPTVIVLILQV